MKKIFIAVVIVFSGAVLSGSLRVESARLNGELNSKLAVGRAQAAEIETAKSERAALQNESHALRNQLAAARAVAGGEVALLDSAAALVLANQTLSPEQSEKLLAELGFNWNTTGGYLVVSKQTLRHVSMDGMKGPKLTDAVCGVLAVSASERAAIETTAQSIFDDYAAWMKSNVQRTEPKGDMVCEYKVTFDEAYSQSASNTFATQVSSTLGKERGELFLDYASEWMRSTGMRGTQPTTMTVNQHNKNEARYQFTLKSTYSTMTTEINPWQPFPEAFKPLFPNGWADLAKAEGFELPKEFEKHKER